MVTRSFQLPSTAPFWFEDLVWSHGWVCLLPYQWCSETKTVLRCERLTSGKMVSLGVRSSMPAAAVDGIEVEAVTSEPMDEGEEALLRAGLRRAFVLEERFEPWWALCAEEPRLRRAYERRQGRMLRSLSLFEDMVKTVCTINTTWSQTKAMVANLVRHYGPGDGAIERPEGMHHGGTEDTEPNERDRAFPTAAVLAAVEPEALRERARVGYRAETISGLARAVVEGRLDLDRLQDAALPDAAVVETLRAPRGFGPYAVAHMMMLLGRYDFLPIDSWLRRTVSDAWFEGRSATDREILAAFERFRPYRTLAYHFYDWQGAERREAWAEPAAPY
jgi:3-methyladenine DNA glycosylase/8-oxoguanine DNA glycosylase